MAMLRRGRRTAQGGSKLQQCESILVPVVDDKVRDALRLDVLERAQVPLNAVHESVCCCHQERRQSCWVHYNLPVAQGLVCWVACCAAHCIHMHGPACSSHPAFDRARPRYSRVLAFKTCSSHPDSG